ncbi:MAG: hypothetical protein LBI06_01245 [Treponema sp.]|jgi:hypothetical protein|nr:hypothetical protein [Treponema sp.]
MPWRLIQFIFFFVIFLFFIGFNLENKCNINFWPGKLVLENVPVFFTAFCSFAAGMLCALPLVLSFRSRKKAEAALGKGLLEKMARKKGKSSDASSLSDKGHYGID